MNKVYVAPSILACDFGHLADEIKRVEDGGADYIHVDVMDGHFVPNISIGIPVVKSLKKITNLPLEVHLMIENPEKYIQAFVDAGSDFLTFHQEAVDDSPALLKKIKDLGIPAGVSIKPNTSVDTLKGCYDIADLILVMTVEPGFGGQSFMHDCVKKILLIREQFSGIVAVDGGVNVETSQICRDAGANFLVAGTAVFKREDVDVAISEIRGS